VKSHAGGFVTRCDARIIGEVIRDLGGGRLTKESVLNPCVGVDQIAKPGESVEAGSTLARVHAADDQQAQAAVQRIQAAFAVGAEAVSRNPLVVETLS
ncbi:MAG: hypothetical protein RLY20_2213, partial [Verrucomicrobiota bacterium]|jgi:thymidine phosphorylase